MGAKLVEVALKTAELQTAKEISSKFSARMQASVKDLGQVDSMRHTILAYVASENYQRSIDELKRYVADKDAYPQFEVRAQRYYSYAIDLINAVRVKRSFPGLQNLAMAKQQELFDRAMEHFEDLKVTLKKIEQIDREVRLEDVRSTVMVVKAIIYSVFAISVLGFLLEVSRGLVPAAVTVVDSSFGWVVDFIFNKLGI